MRSAFVVLSLSLTVIGISGACAQSGSFDGQFVGKWRLVSWAVTDDAGRVSEPFGPEAMGRMMYADSGRMSMHVTNPKVIPPDADVAGVNPYVALAQSHVLFV